MPRYRATSEHVARGQVRSCFRGAMQKCARPSASMLLLVTRRGVKPSEPEFANACLVEAEVVTNLVTHRLYHVEPEALAIVPEVAHKSVAKNQDLVWQATAPEERRTTTLGADIHAVRVVLGTAVGNDDRYLLQRTLELDRQLVER